MNRSQSTNCDLASKYGLQHNVSDASLPPKLEDIKKQLKEEIRKELKIKEGAENLRKVTTDKKSLSNVNSIVKKANSKLHELQQELQELNAYMLVFQGHSSDLNFSGNYSVIFFFYVLLKFLQLLLFFYNPIK